VIFSSFNGHETWSTQTIWVELTGIVVLLNEHCSVCHISTSSLMLSIGRSGSSVQQRWTRASASLAVWYHWFYTVLTANLWLLERSTSHVAMMNELIAIRMRLTLFCQIGYLSTISLRMNQQWVMNISVVEDISKSGNRDCAVQCWTCLYGCCYGDSGGIVLLRLL